jgi:ribosome silencing factor RsfS/YbeB/iojap
VTPRPVTPSPAARKAPLRAPRTPAEAAEPQADATSVPEIPTPAKRAAVAGPRRGRAAPAREAPSPDRLEALVRAAVESLEDDKAENVVVLDVATRSAFADRMIVATGLAERQIEAMARHVEEALDKEGIRRIRTEASPDWVLLDAGDIVIHLFKPEARANYALERMWGAESPPAEDEPTAEYEFLAEEEPLPEDTPVEEEARTEGAPDENGTAEEGKGEDEESKNEDTAPAEPQAEDKDAGAAEQAANRETERELEREILPRDELLDGPAGATLRHPTDEEDEG